MKRIRPLILIIDDDVNSLKVIGSLLHSEYDVQFANSGESGLEYAAKYAPDLILMDVMMPGIDGFETFERIKKNPVISSTPVVFVTASTDTDSEVTGLSLGAVDYIVKPIDSKIARHRINNILERENLRKEIALQRDLLVERFDTLVRVTEDLKKARINALKNENIKHAVLNSLPFDVLVLDKIGVIQASNDQWKRSCSKNISGLLSLGNEWCNGINFIEHARHLLSLVPQECFGLEGMIEGVISVLNGNLPKYIIEYQYKSIRMENRWFELNVFPLLAIDLPGVILFQIEVTTKKQMMNRLQASEAHLQAVVMNEPECIKIVDAGGKLLEMNPAGLFIIEASDLEQVRGKYVIDLIAPEYKQEFLEMHQRVISGENAQLEFEVVGLHGRRTWLETHAVPMQFEGQTVHLAITRDITERRKAEQEIKKLAFYDPLTKLANRRLFEDKLCQSLKFNRRSENYSALMFLDLDNFKSLNDQYGHDVGDALLVAIANKILNCVRVQDTVARFGGDEFVLLLNILSTDYSEAKEQSVSVAEKILQSINVSLNFKNCGVQTKSKEIECKCTASIGLIVFGNTTKSNFELLRAADQAMYEAKYTGRNKVRFFEEYS